jgi:hypothetical protein
MLRSARSSTAFCEVIQVVFDHRHPPPGIVRQGPLAVFPRALAPLTTGEPLRRLSAYRSGERGSERSLLTEAERSLLTETLSANERLKVTPEAVQGREPESWAAPQGGRKRNWVCRKQRDSSTCRAGGCRPRCSGSGWTPGRMPCPRTSSARRFSGSGRSAGERRTAVRMCLPTFATLMRWRTCGSRDHRRDSAGLTEQI